MSNKGPDVLGKPKIGGEGGQKSVDALPWKKYSQYHYFDLNDFF